MQTQRDPLFLILSLGSADYSWAYSVALSFLDSLCKLTQFYDSNDLTNYSQNLYNIYELTAMVNLLYNL